MLTAHRAVLGIAGVLADVAIFADPDGDTPESHILTQQDWDDMGRPTTITVTAEPGDHLNEQKD